jgi:hypothetical protein
MDNAEIIETATEAPVDTPVEALVEQEDPQVTAMYQTEEVAESEDDSDAEDEADGDSEDEEHDESEDEAESGEDESEEDQDEDESEDEARTPLPIRAVLRRQLVAGQTLSSELIEAASDLTAAIAETPATVVNAVRGGATLPAAFTHSTDALHDVVADAGDRVRAAVGDYIGNQANLPNAVIGGAAEVAGSVVRAQGSIASSAVDAAFTVATVAAHGGELRDALDREWRELSATASSARENVNHTFDVARQGIRQAAAVGAG